MANLGKKNGIYLVRFRFQGREFKRSLKANAAKNLIELTIHRLVTGQTEVPAGVDPGDFVFSGGTLKEPRQSREPVLILPTVRQLTEQYAASQRHLQAESYHSSQAMHLRHLSNTSVNSPRPRSTGLVIASWTVT